MRIPVFKWAKAAAAISNHTGDWNVVVGRFVLCWTSACALLLLCFAVMLGKVERSRDVPSVIKGGRRDLVSGANTNTLRCFYTYFASGRRTNADVWQLMWEVEDWEVGGGRPGRWCKTSSSKFEAIPNFARDGKNYRIGRSNLQSQEKEQEQDPLSQWLLSRMVRSFLFHRKVLRSGKKPSSLQLRQFGRRTWEGTDLGQRVPDNR